MPFDTIGVEVVEDTNADFVSITVVGLGFSDGFSSVTKNMGNWVKKLRIFRSSYFHVIKRTLQYETKIFGLQRNLHVHQKAK